MIIKLLKKLIKKGKIMADNQNTNDVSANQMAGGETTAAPGTEAAPGTVPAEPQSTDVTTTDTPVDTTTQVDDGKLTRMEQDMAKKNRVLDALGINPDSDVADRFDSGLLTRDELLREAGHTEPAPAYQQPEQPRDPMATLTELRQKISSEAYTDPKDLDAVIGTMQDILVAQDQRSRQKDVQDHVNTCKSVVNKVYDSDPTIENLPIEIQQIERLAFEASTDALLERENPNNPYQYATPVGYKFYAEKNARRFQQMRDYYINLGRTIEKTGGNPPVTNPVVPISSSQGGSPTPSPPVRITRENMKQKAREYQAQRGIV